MVQARKNTNIIYNSLMIGYQGIGSLACINNLVKKKPSFPLPFSTHFLITYFRFHLGVFEAI